MASVKNDPAARAAAEAARRRAEAEARKRAEEAAKRAADALKKVAPQQPLPKTMAAAKFRRDELSTGAGGALRSGAMARLGATGLPLPSAPTPMRAMTAQAPTANALSGQLQAQQQALDTATSGLPPARAKDVQDAVKVVTSAGVGVSDPGQRAKATADAIAAQSARFEGDPAAARAFAQAVAPQVEAIGRDLSGAITTPLKGDADRSTKATIEALAQAAERLGTGGAMQLGRSLAAGAPDVENLNHFDDSLEDVASNSEGGRALFFGVAAGFEAQGKTKALGDVQQALRVSTIGLSPGEVMTPVDPKDPDALAQAEFKLAQARVMMAEGGLDQQDLYASALQVQLDAFAGDPALRQQLAQSQLGAITELAETSTLSGWRLSVALDAAQAAGPAQLQQLTDAYAEQLGQTNLDLRDIAQSVSPEAAKALAFSFARVGNTELAGVFARRAADTLDGVASRAKDANDEVATLQARLDQELTNIGAALTPEQKQQYAADFWDKHQGAVDEQKAANAALGSALAADLPTLQRLAELDPEAAKSVASCLKELARDPAQAQSVQDTVNALAASGALPEGFQGVEKELVEATTTATNTLAHQALANGDAAGAADQLKKLHAFLGKTKFATKAVTDFINKTLPKLEEFADVVDEAVRSKDLSKITDYLTSPKADALRDAGKVGEGFGKLISSVTSAVGVAAYLSQAANAPDGASQLLAVMKAGKAGADLLVTGFQAVSSAMREASNRVLREGAEALGKLSKSIEKITPVLGLAIGVLEGFKSIQGAIDDPNLRNVGAAIGDTLSAVGGAIALIPGGQALGGALALVGTGISLVTNFIHGAREDSARRAEQKALLIGVLTEGAKDPKSPYYGLSAQQVEAAAARLSTTGADLHKLAQDAGLTPGQLVQLAVATPAMGESFFRAMNEIGRLSGLKGQAFVDWVKQQPDLEQKLLTWVTSGLEGAAQQSAGLRAHQYAEAEFAKGHDFAEAYNRKYQELYDAELRAMLEAQGLVP